MRMKEKRFKAELTADELELIEAIRNLRSAFPNGYDELYYHAQQLFVNLTDLPQ
jgi:hypothetical protein